MAAIGQIDLQSKETHPEQQRLLGFWY